MCDSLRAAMLCSRAQLEQHHGVPAGLRPALHRPVWHAARRLRGGLLEQHGASACGRVVVKGGRVFEALADVECVEHIANLVISFF